MAEVKPQDEVELQQIYENAEKVFKGDLDSLVEIGYDKNVDKQMKEKLKDKIYSMSLKFLVNQKKADDSVIKEMQEVINEKDTSIGELKTQLKIKNEIQEVEMIDENEEVKKDSVVYTDIDESLKKV